MAQYSLSNFSVFNDYGEDREFEQLKRFANPYEIKRKVHFSVTGLVRYFEDLLANE